MRKNRTIDIEDAVGNKGTLEVRMGSQQERKMACPKVVGQKTTTTSEEMAEV
jgi:hypothetical protein